MDELQDERPTSDYPLTSREEVAPNNGLKHRGLARRLGTHNDDLGEVDSFAADGVEGVLELVDDGDEVAVHRHDGELGEGSREAGYRAQRTEFEGRLALGGNVDVGVVVSGD